MRNVQIPEGSAEQRVRREGLLQLCWQLLYCSDQVDRIQLNEWWAEQGRKKGGVGSSMN